jgi:hypothetical protein
VPREVIHWPTQPPDYGYAVATVHSSRGRMTNIAVAG